jgi:preprotein translocase subunit SecG
MVFYLTIAQLVISVLLVICILLQSKGAGLGAGFGGAGNAGNVYSTKRGAEKFLFTSTIVLATLFLGIAITTIILL